MWTEDESTANLKIFGTFEAIAQVLGLIDKQLSLSDSVRYQSRNDLRPITSLRKGITPLFTRISMCRTFRERRIVPSPPGTCTLPDVFLRFSIFPGFDLSQCFIVTSRVTWPRPILRATSFLFLHLNHMLDVGLDEFLQRNEHTRSRRVFFIQPQLSPPAAEPDRDRKQSDDDCK